MGTVSVPVCTPAGARGRGGSSAASLDSRAGRAGMNITWCRFSAWRLLTVFVMLLLPGLGMAAPVSEAEQVMFLDDHLANVTRSETLEYRIVSSGTLDAPYTSRAAVAVRLAKDAKAKTATSDCFDGPHQVNLPPAEDAHGNPVVLCFLEAAVRDMKRRTGGAQAFFRRRIRMALAEAAQVQSVQFEFDGRQVSGTQIRVRPYRNDPMRERLKNFDEVLFVLTFSSQIPGSVYQIRSEVAGRDGGAPAILEVLTFSGVGAFQSISSEVQ